MNSKCYIKYINGQLKRIEYNEFKLLPYLCLSTVLTIIYRRKKERNICIQNILIFIYKIENCHARTLILIDQVDVM